MAPVISGLSAIFLAPLLALLLGRAVLVEVVEFAAGEHCATMMASSWSNTCGGGMSIAARIVSLAWLSESSTSLLDSTSLTCSESLSLFVGRSTLTGPRRHWSATPIPDDRGLLPPLA